ncbi:MAG: hypothetical protein OEU09_09575 [Rhodospirillales bacterium]|nr:hypothetical protein [Rhodospirillales bacterium]
MDIRKLTRFFLWCTIINGALLIVSFAAFAIGGTDFVYQTHGKWFSVTPETFNAVLYLFLGLYKIAILVFNLVPYVALRIVAKD